MMLLKQFAFPENLLEDLLVLNSSVFRAHVERTFLEVVEMNFPEKIVNVFAGFRDQPAHNISLG
jgi:hypothetical protein